MAGGMRFAVRCFLVFVLLNAASAYVPRIRWGRPRTGFLKPPPAPKGVVLPSAMWFEDQRLDHFNGADIRTWEQRYFVNDTFYRPGGPIFLMLGGEGPADPVWSVVGAWMDYARMYNAFCVQLEHRYYGKSHPTDDISTENLQWLSSRQALADTANFIDMIRKKFNLKENKLITFGGSYSGSLSAWFRLKYPSYVDGAVATSAPLFAKTDFKEYLAVVRDSLATTGSKCNYEIEMATKTLLDWYEQEDKREKIYEMFWLCDKIDHEDALDMANFFESVAGNFEDVVQYNKDNRAFEGAKGTNITIDTLCGIMCDDSRGPPIQRYADVNSLILNTYNQTCLDYKYKNMIDDMKKTDWNSSASVGGRQWMYQTCTEFGWYQSFDEVNQPFGPGTVVPVNFSFDQCMDIFGQHFDGALIEDNVAQTNQNYGGYNYKGTKVVFPNGSIDPWHAMGVTKDISEEAPAIYINGTAHCANMYPASPDDLPGLVQSRVTIAKLIAQWISS